MTDTPAFPSSPTVGANGDLMRPVDIGCEGMSLRDYFAAKALAAMIGLESKNGSTRGASGVPILIRYAYEYADAMLAERSKP